MGRHDARQLAKGDQRRRPSDAQLRTRSAELSQRYLGGQARPTSIRWVTNQNSRWGSCTPADGTIRISTRVKGMPGYVLDYVILHELAHLLAPGHGPDFWALLEGYPRLERARGYLEGVAATAGLDLSDGETDSDELGQAALRLRPERLSRSTAPRADRAQPSSRRAASASGPISSALASAAARPPATRRRRATRRSRHTRPRRGRPRRNAGRGARCTGRSPAASSACRSRWTSSRVQLEVGDARTPRAPRGSRPRAPSRRPARSGRRTAATARPWRAA